MSGLDELEQFGLRLASLGEALPEAMPIFARKVDALIEQQFNNGTDPYGVPWAPLAQSTLDKGRTPPPLTDTGAMRASRSVEARGNSIAIAFDDPFRYHNEGTEHVPRRQILPSGALPNSWEQAADEAAQDALARKLGVK